MDEYKKFYTDLDQGELGEQVIAEHFYKRGWEILEFRKDKDYDIRMKMGNCIKLLEIKTDRYEFFNQKETNNMFLELYCANRKTGVYRKSGILGSKADIFVYYYPDHQLSYFIKMERVRELINYGWRAEQSGDGERVKGILINRFEFGDWFKIVKIEKDFRWNKILEGAKDI